MGAYSDGGVPALQCKHASHNATVVHVTLYGRTHTSRVSSKIN